VNSVLPRSGVDAESWAKYFFTIDFLANPFKIMRRKFVEYLGTDCFNFCRIPVKLSVVSGSNAKLWSPPQMRNARITSYSWCAGGLLEADSHVGL
jgi:methyl coenzyme M reductase alpha subunit